MNRVSSHFRALMGAGIVALATVPAQAALVDFQGEVTNPNATIGAGNIGNMIGNGSFGWQTGNTSIDVITNGFNFTLDSGNGNGFNYAGSISGDSDVRFRMAPVWSGLANNAMIVSGATSNAYTGTSFIEYGHVQLQKSGGATAIAGNVVIGGQGSNDRLSLGASDQIADTSMISFTGPHTATFNVNGFSETVGIVQVTSNAVIDLGAGGSLSAKSFNVDGNWLAPGTYDAGSLAFLTGSGTLSVLSADVAAGNAISLNFAGGDNNPGGRKVLGPSLVAGAPGFEQSNWNNTPGQAQVGANSSSNDTLTNLFDNKGFISSVDVTFSAGQTWGHNWGSNPTADQILNGNGISDQNPIINVTQVPFSEYEVIVYVGNYDGAGAVTNSVITLTDEFGNVFERFVAMPYMGDFVDWIEITDASVSADTRELGNYLVFSGFFGSEFDIALNGRGTINGIQIVAPAAIAVPEPTTAMLLGLASCGLAFVRRSRREASVNG